MLADNLTMSSNSSADLTIGVSRANIFAQLSIAVIVLSVITEKKKFDHWTYT